MTFLGQEYSLLLCLDLVLYAVNNYFVNNVLQTASYSCVKKIGFLVKNLSRGFLF